MLHDEEGGKRGKKEAGGGGKQLGVGELGGVMGAGDKEKLNLGDGDKEDHEKEADRDRLGRSRFAKVLPQEIEA